MKPHLAHINNTLIKKRLAKEANNEQGDYLKYAKRVEAAKMEGFSENEILIELQFEKLRIEKDWRDGDSIFQEGLGNAKESCLKALDRVISELKQKGES